MPGEFNGLHSRSELRLGRRCWFVCDFSVDLTWTKVFSFSYLYADMENQSRALRWISLEVISIIIFISIEADSLRAVFFYNYAVVGCL